MCECVMSCARAICYIVVYCRGYITEQTHPYQKPKSYEQVGLSAAACDETVAVAVATVTALAATTTLPGCAEVKVTLTVAVGT